MIETLGKYEILGLLGKGTMGEVYLARDPFLDRKVALKTIRSGSAFAGEDKARFEREARAMAALNHPSIVTVYDFGTVGETFYLAMEYLEGEDLAAVIRGGSTSKVDLLEALEHSVMVQAESSEPDPLDGMLAGWPDLDKRVLRKAQHEHRLAR